MKSSARDAADGKSVAAAAAAAAAARSSETAYDDSVGTSSDSLLGMAVRRVVLDLDGSAGDQADGPADADSRRVRTKPEPRRTPPSKKKLGTRERIASLPPDLAQVVFDAVVATKRLGAGGVPLARQFKYLWFVDLAACGDVAEDDVVETLLSTNARTLLRLSVARCRRLTEASLRGLERRHAFPALTHLDLSECATVTDETLACVARAPNLETLKAEGCAVVGGGLRHVSKLEKLKHLSLERCGRLGGAMLGDVGERGRGPVPENVAAPSVAHATNVSDLADAALRAAKKRRTDEEGGAGAEEDARYVVGVPALAALETLETLSLGWCNRVSDADIATLGGLKALRKLVLARTRAGAAAAAAIRRLPNLVALDLTGTPFDDDALAVLTGFSLGFETGVGGARGEAASSPPATGPPALRELSLEATRVTGRAGVLVAGAFASSLVGLNAAFTEMSDDGARSMRDMSALRHVNLDSCPVGDGAARALSNLPDLESVTLADTDVGNDGVEALARRATRLTHLDLGHTLMDDDGVEHLLLLKHTLRSLSLDSRLISDRGVKRIADLRSLESLDLFAADVTDAGVGALREMRALKSLEMCGGRVTDVGVARVARFCENLETLNLGQNPAVTDAGAAAVAASLKKLTALNLTGSGVTDAGAKKFAALKNLTTLALKECRGVTREAARYLREHCPKLTEVTFAATNSGRSQSGAPNSEAGVAVETQIPAGPGPVAIVAPVVVDDVADELAAEAAEAVDAAETESSESFDADAE